MLTISLCLAALLVGYTAGLYGYTRAENAAFRRLLAAQGRGYAIVPEDVQ